MSEFTNIDDVLSSAKSPLHPETPEHQPEMEESIDEPVEFESQSYDEEPEESTDSEPKEAEPKDYDDYGNEKPKSKMYSEDEVNERINKAIRERLARGNNQTQQQPAQQAVQQQTQQNFEYDPEAGGNWQQQLEAFVEQTVSKMSQKQVNQQNQYREQVAQAEFESRFTQGMDKFRDFRDVVSMQPITDSMTIALRGMKDPASFIYAASKRNPQELQRIANIPDAVTQMVEMGKLEERMRKAATGTNAPKPISRTKEDTGLQYKDKKGEPSIEQLIAQSDARRMTKMKLRRGK
jgi:hypothetical protein